MLTFTPLVLNNAGRRLTHPLDLPELHKNQIQELLKLSRSVWQRSGEDGVMVLEPVVNDCGQRKDRGYGGILHEAFTVAA